MQQIKKSNEPDKTKERAAAGYVKGNKAKEKAKVVRVAADCAHDR